MTKTIHLTQLERDELSKNLDEKQKQFIDEYLIRGRKTVFANVLAKGKAGGVEETEIEKVANQWELQDFIDAGPGWRENPKLFCECGRALRYQYIVLNKETKELKKFGINHFEEHVGIPPQLVKEIIKGIEVIDYERDEILVKINQNWNLIDEGIVIPEEFDIPKDIEQHLEYNVPLLDRQITRLKTIITEYNKLIERERLERNLAEQKSKQERKKQHLAQRREALLQQGRFQFDLELDPALQAGIMIYLEDLNRTQFLASEVCQYLIDYHGASNEKYSSGTFKIFPQVCLFLENLTKNEEIVFLGRKRGIDRLYQISG